MTAVIVMVGLAVTLLLVLLATSHGGISSTTTRAPLLVTIQTLVSAYSNPNDIQCSANAQCPSEDALYKDKLIQTNGLTGSAGVSLDSATGEYLVSLYAQSGGSALVVVHFAKDSGVNPNSIVAGMNVTVAGTFGGLQLAQTGTCPLHCLSLLHAELVGRQGLGSSVSTMVCGAAEEGSCGI